MQDVPYGFCHCGCGRQTRIIAKTWKARGEKKGEPRLYCNGHFHSRRDRYEIRDCGYETPCWVWKGFTNGHPTRPYGRSSWAGHRTTAHRAFYERYVGAVPPGMDLDHLCRNTLCVNPEHLEPVSRSKNLRRGAGTKLTPELVREIRTSPERHADVARAYGIHPNTVRSIRTRRIWKDVE
jgi:hypothetical protein